jgi:glycine C-acetyltransferase
VAGTIKTIEIIRRSTLLRDKLEENAKYFRQRIKDAGFEIKDGFHPIVPVMIHDAGAAQTMARELYSEGIYVVGFFYPVVPKGQARIRVQLSAAHEKRHIDKAIDAFTKVGKKLKVI